MSVMGASVVKFKNDKVLFTASDKVAFSCEVLCGVSTDDDIDVYFYDIAHCVDVSCTGDCTNLNGNTYQCVYIGGGQWQYSSGGTTVTLSCAAGDWILTASVPVNTWACFFGSKSPAAMPTTIDNDYDCSPNQCGDGGSADLSIH